MSEYTVETIDLDNRHRIVVEYDQDASCPRLDYASTGFVNVEFDPWRRSGGFNEIPEVHDDPTGRIAEAHDKLFDHGYGRTVAWYDEGREHAMVRWARIFHDLTIVYENGVEHHEGYWFADPKEMRENWPENLVGTEKYREQERAVIDQEHETYRQWAAGEVYTVSLEEWVELTGSLVEGSIINQERWVEIDSLSGCYLDDSYTAQNVVEQQFDTRSLSTEALAKLKAGAAQ